MAEGRHNAVSVAEKLEKCRGSLATWSRRKFGETERSLRTKTAQLATMQLHDGPHNQAEIKVLKTELADLLNQEEIYWKQRAKQAWLAKWDRNTPYFHAWANQRRRSNKIRSITDDAGREWVNEKGIQWAFVQSYGKLYTSDGSEGIADCLEGLEALVNAGMNQHLLAEFTAVEVESALKQMGPLKLPGPDGFAACFSSIHGKRWGLRFVGKL